MANKQEAIFILEIDVKRDKTQLFFLKNIKVMAFPGLWCFVVVFLCSGRLQVKIRRMSTLQGTQEEKTMMHVCAH